MELVALVTMVVVLEYLVFSLLTGRARGTFNVPAPATTGHPVFERYYRVQQNTLEQIAVTLPSLWIFALYVSQPIAAGLGAVFVGGRILYFAGYVRDPSKRGTGFLIGFLATSLLVVGAIVGTIAAAF